MTGRVVVAGLGPGAEALVTPEVRAALDEATDVIGYIPYVARVADRPGLVKHASDNRVELDENFLINLSNLVSSVTWNWKTNFSGSTLPFRFNCIPSTIDINNKFTFIGGKCSIESCVVNRHKF